MITPLLLIFVAVAADDVAPPPLTPEQLAAVRTLVQRTQAEQGEARKSLLAAQERLARSYAEYDLDQQQVGKLQSEIIEQQRKLLDSHHRMHTELRTIVSGPRFQILSQRIENALRNPLDASKAPTSSRKPSEK